MINTLYGDGINDDTLAIQEMIDNSNGEVVLPNPKAFYLISAPLELPSDFRLVLPRFCEIKLKANSNCVMLKNKTIEDKSKRQTLHPAWGFLDEYSPDAPCQNIEVTGGIWNFNNKEQHPNPMYVQSDEHSSYSGFAMLFYNVKNLRISSLTIKDPVTFAVMLDTVSYFTVDNIIFDFNYGNPLATNMDGIHIDGNCHYGDIRNLKGACYDDLVALNADEGLAGDITNINIDGIYSEDCHSAVRLLAAKQSVKNIHISNVYGTYFQYCIGITRFYPTDDKGQYDGITLENIYASKAFRYPVYAKPEKSYVYPLIYIEDKLHIKNLKISNLVRREYITPVDTIHIKGETEIDQLVLENISVENHTDAESIPLFVNNGNVKYLIASGLYNDNEKVEL